MNDIARDPQMHLFGCVVEQINSVDDDHIAVTLSHNGDATGTHTYYIVAPRSAATAFAVGWKYTLSLTRE